MSYNVTYNSYLRQMYGSNSELSAGNVRKHTASAKLVTADTTALGKGVLTMNRQDYKTRSSDPDEDKAIFYGTMKAFLDTYNNTIDSGSASQDKDIRKLASKIKGLAREFENDLKALGITIDDDGYLQTSEEDLQDLNNKKFEEVFGEDSEFTGALRKLAKKIYKHIDQMA